MAHIILIIALIFFITVSGQRYAPSSLVGQELHYKPCTRRKEIHNNNPILPLYPWAFIPNNNVNADKSLIPQVLKSDEVVPARRPDRYGEFFQNNNAVVLFPEQEVNDEENATTIVPEPLLINNQTNIENQPSLPPYDTKHEDLRTSIAGNAAQKPAQTNHPESKTLEKNINEKSEDIPNVYDKENVRDLFYEDLKKTISNNAVQKPVQSYYYEIKPLEKNIKEKSDDIPDVRDLFFEDCNENYEDVPTNLETRRLMSDTDDIFEANESGSQNIEPNNEQNDNYRKSNTQESKNVLADPARGTAISGPSSLPVNLLTHSRVCYACSTVNNPTCWNPDRRTTVKYCRIGHEACVTKTFQTDSDKWILTRDCGKTCDDTDIPGPKYKSCSVCHSDMCNDSTSGSPSIAADKLVISVFVLFIVKSAL